MPARAGPAPGPPEGRACAAEARCEPMPAGSLPSWARGFDLVQMRLLERDGHWQEGHWQAPLACLHSRESIPVGSQAESRLEGRLLTADASNAADAARTRRGRRRGGEVREGGPRRRRRARARARWRGRGAASTPPAGVVLRIGPAGKPRRRWRRLMQSNVSHVTPRGPRRRRALCAGRAEIDAGAVEAEQARMRRAPPTEEGQGAATKW